MPLYGYRLHAIGIDRMMPAFPQKMKTTFAKIANQIPPLYGHLLVSDLLYFNRHLLNQSPAYRNLFTLLFVGLNHLPQSVLQHLPAIFQRLSFRDRLRPLNQLAHVTRWNLCVLRREAAHHFLHAQQSQLGCLSLGRGRAATPPSYPATSFLNPRATLSQSRSFRSRTRPPSRSCRGPRPPRS